MEKAIIPIFTQHTQLSGLVFLKQVSTIYDKQGPSTSFKENNTCIKGKKCTPKPIFILLDNGNATSISLHHPACIRHK